MAHLSIEYSRNLAPDLDMDAFCDRARRAMIDTGIFPIAGIRVRAFAADHVSIANGDADLGFADCLLRMGPGRSEEARATAVEEIYAALEKFVEGKLSIPFALSLEVIELNYPFAEKRMNTIRPALNARGENNV